VEVQTPLECSAALANTGGIDGQWEYRSLAEQGRQIDRLGHGTIVGVIRMQVVAGIVRRPQPGRVRRSRRMASSASPHHTSSRSLRSIPSRAFERRGGVVTFLENCTRHVPEVVDGMFRTSVSGFDGTMRERSVVAGTMIGVDERISGKLVGECAHSGSEE